MQKNTLALKTAVAISTLGAFSSANAIEVTGGSISLDYNSHFISYGFDVWGTGNDTFDTPLFNPSISVDFGIDENSGAYVGAWADINSEGANGQISTEELDLWIGYYYTMGDFTIDTAVQAWMYASQTEMVWDLSFSYDTTEAIGFNLSPAVLFHTRFQEGAAPNNGVILDLSIGYGVDVGDSGLSIGVPLAVGFALTEGYHFDNGPGMEGESGLAYVKTGVEASYPLAFIGENWDVHGGVLYYHTPDDVTGNADEDFITVSAGVGISW